MYLVLFLCVLCMQSISLYAKSEPCPFNKDCTCLNHYSPISPSSVTFDYVQCKSKDGKLPKFDPAPKKKYYVYNDFFIENADLRVIPGKHFSAFEYIGYLHLDHKSEDPVESVKINWDDDAFYGVQVIGMYTDGLDGLIPVPAALKNIGIKYLYVYNGHAPISIKDDSFKNLLGLQYLTVFNTTIQEITPNAFSGLENTVQSISFEYSEIRGFDSLKDAIKNLNKLGTLDLAHNAITELKSDSFPEMTLNYLHLTGNPIEKIDKKSFTTLKGLSYVSLNYVQTLTSADMAAFTGLKTDSLIALFYNDQSLKSVVVSDAGEFPNITTFDFSATGIETIDSKVADIMEKYPGMFLYLDQNTHLKCDGLEWISKIECPARMWIDDSKCADKQGQKLVDYLKSVDPESKCKENVNLPRPLQMRGKYRTEYRRQF